jgi:hypothetical protein
MSTSVARLTRKTIQIGPGSRAKSEYVFCYFKINYPDQALHFQALGTAGAEFSDGA